MWFFYNLIFPFVFVLLSPFYFWKMTRRGGWRRGFGQRFGFYDAEFREKIAGGADVWVQAVSVGEVGIAKALIEKLREQNPALRVVLTTTTSTGQAEAQKVFPPQAGTSVSPVLVGYFPLDWAPITARALNLFRPKLFVIVETEIWPNAIRRAKRRGMTVALVNGRISDKSYLRYSRLGFMFRDVFGQLDVVLAQSEAEARRFEALGVARERVKSAGQIKFDLSAGDAVPSEGAWQALERCGVEKGRRILVCGSTFAGEEEILFRVAKELRGQFPDLFVVLVPRHAERRGKVIELARHMGVKMAVRSELDSRTRTNNEYDCACLLVDTTGELRGFYEVADVVFVGKSLTAHGGQNPIEPAAAGKAILIGPHTENFRNVMTSFRAADAVVEVRDEGELEIALERLLANEEERIQLGQRARGVVVAHRGALRATAEELLRLLR